MAAEESSRSYTNNSAIMDLTERRLLITDGPPGEATYHEHWIASSN